MLRLHRVAMRRRSRQRNHNESPVLERRQFLVRSMAGMGVAAGGSAGALASRIDPRDVQIREYEVAVRDLPKEMHGLRLLHISDTHYGPYTGLSFLEQVAGHANRLEPDIVLMTGDYVHLTPLSIEGGIEVLSAYKARFGSLAVMGNHEHWEGALACRRMFEKIGLPLIDNDRIYLTRDGLTSKAVPGRSICIAGLGDLWEDRVDIEKAVGGVADDVPRIILSHNPDSAEIIAPARQRVDLILSGHTHGGQISLPIVGPPGTGSRHGRKYLGGLCNGPQCPVIVSRGVGTAFIPVRFRVPPEIGIIKLTTA
jgi:predicted MPP superfamily phosphohydrolase